MPKIPFSVYDFFGYLATGYLLTLAVDYALPGNWLLKQNFTVGEALFWIVVIYVTGHINANFASWLLEGIFVSKILNRPEKVLLLDGGRVGLKRWIFPGYFSPLPESVRARIRSRMKSLGVEDAALFHHARTLAKKDEATWARLDVFLAQYGFCRNMAFGLLVTGGLLFRQNAALAITAIAGGVAMVYRYLKFFRQYSFELFSSYPDLDIEGDKSETKPKRK